MSNAVQHIGIVACSAEGASLCYRTICTEGPAQLGGHAHPEVTMHTPSLEAYAVCLDRGDWRGVAELMLRSAETLSNAGADFLICPDNTIHQAFPMVTQKSPLPWLHIAAEVVKEMDLRGYRKPLLIGTKWLMESDVYPGQLSADGLELAVPDVDARLELNRIIMDELVLGRCEAESIRYLQQLIERHADEGCDCVILGCTELPLVLDDGNSALPVLDSTRLLARAALRRAIGC